MNIQYATIDDFEDVYSLYNNCSKLIGPAVPHAIKERIANKECLIVRNDAGALMGACNFHVLRKEERTSIYEVAVWKEHRRLGVAKNLVYYIRDAYKRPVVAKCIKDSPSELFWSTIGVKLREEEGRKQPVSVYQVGEVRKVKGLLDLI